MRGLPVLTVVRPLVFQSGYHGMSDNCLQIARKYLAALERGDTDEALSYLAADIVQQEFPNRLSPSGAIRDIAAMREGAARGKQLLSAQTYEVLGSIAAEDQVALEVQWTGTLAVAVGNVPPGGQLRARFAVFLEFRGGQIVRQRNYDCFDPM
jgi:ketosteroid isomerase-like protein